MDVSEERRGYTIKITDKSDFGFSAFSSPILERTDAGEAADAADVDAGEPTEILTIDGHQVPFTVSDEGYNIYYLPPQSSLLEAAQNYVDTQPEKQP